MFKKRKEKKDRQSVNLDHGQCCLVPPGQVTILRDLGEGQYGSVQLGEWKQPAVGMKYVAVKSLKNIHIDGVLSAMLKEAAIMQKLQNPHIVTLFGISLPEGEEPLKLVTEYADWGSLQENLVKQNEWVCDVSTLSRFAAQIAHGMQYLASHQLVHRDLATRNILVFSPDLVKICDFGLARTMEENGARELTAHQKLALAWVAPETITRQVFTPTSDVWSYGVTLWEMFTFGKQPFSGFTFQQIKRVVTEDAVSYLPKPLACPDDFYDVMLLCLKREPEQRPTFEFIYSCVSQIHLKDGITKTSHDSNEDGYLSYKCKQKVTLITSCEKGIILVQHESGSVGKVEEKNINFSAKATKGKSPEGISTHLSKSKSIPELPSNKRVERKQDEQVTPIRDPDERYSFRLSDGEGDETAGPTYPDPYPNMDLWHNQPIGDEFRNEAARKSITSKTPVNVNDDFTRNPETLQQEHGHAPLNDTEIEYTFMGYAERENNEYTSMGHVAQDASSEELQKAQGSNATTTPLRLPRPGRTQSESELQGITNNKNVYEVLWCEKPPRPEIPARLDLVNRPRTEHSKPRAANIVERKRTPVPLPRLKRTSSMPPVSDCTLGMDRAQREDAIGASNGNSDNANLHEVESKFQHNKALNHSSSAERTDDHVRQADKPLGRREELQSGTADVEGSSQEGADHFQGLLKTNVGKRLGVKGQNTENHNEESVTVHYGQGKVDSDPLEPETGRFFTKTAALETTSRLPHDHVDLLVEDASAMSTTCAASHRPSEIKTTPPPPPPLPPKVGNYLDPQYSEPLGVSPCPAIQPAVLIQPGNPFVSTPSRNTPNSDVHGSIGSQGQPQFDHLATRGALMSHHDDSNSEGIHQKILQIQGVCQDLTRDFCYAALLQHEGNVEDVIRIVKSSQLAISTGKSYQFCERTLKHCNWNLDRAANYIMDNFADKVV